MKYIRNFSIIAHIDHGKSTLADRFIEICKNKKINSIEKKILDSLEIEKEKGITIKSQCVTLNYKYKNNKYTLNIIDTPGHVDFSYEVSRALAACEGVILLIDGSQGIEAQTISNLSKAKEEKLTIIAVINKIDIKHINICDIEEKIKTQINIKKENIIKVSAKTGENVKLLIENIIEKIPPPNVKDNKLKALIIDSWYDNYLGVMSLIKVKSGTLKKNDEIITNSTKKICNIKNIGIFTPSKKYKNELNTGEIGFIVTGNKNIKTFLSGDTIFLKKYKNLEPILGFEKIKPNIYASIFPEDQKKFKFFETAMSKLSLNDSSLIYNKYTSNLFGFGFRCGFLGILHMEIIQERLNKEYNINTIITPPSVAYKIIYKNKIIIIDNPSKINEINNNIKIMEPIALIHIFTKKMFIGSIIKLCENKNGIKKEIKYINDKSSISYEMPMSEIIYDFHENLKKLTKGYSSFKYKFIRFKESKMVKLNILINKKKIDALEFIIHKDKAYNKGKNIVEKMKKLIPKHMFEIAIQASIGNKIISRATIKALRKNVTSKCYGGDISRKKKLIEKQKIGKKNLKKIGKVNIPKNIFLKVFEKVN